MRITSELHVAQLIRRVFAAGGFGAVMRRGAAEAGAIFILCRARSGSVVLFTPAAQSLKSRDDGLREFMAEKIEDEAAMEKRFEREARFDPDFWLVEIETDVPEQFIETVSD